MPQQTRIVAPGPTESTVRTTDRQVLEVPAGWVLVPPGDPGLTRRVKAAGPTWTVQEKIGRRVFSRGVWAARNTVERIKMDLGAERSTDAYAKKQAASAKRREVAQAAYVESFEDAVTAFLAFAPQHRDLAVRLARVVAAHATPGGSRTVARTKRIPVERRAEAAVIAWLRHQTTAYDSLKIPRVKGKRREVRRMLAEQSRVLLHGYREGATPAVNCPLRAALFKAIR